MKQKDEWYNGQGNFDIEQFIFTERDNLRYYSTSFDTDTGERAMRVKGFKLFESGKLIVTKTYEGTIADNSKIPHELFGISMHSVAKVTPVLKLRDVDHTIETRTSLLHHEDMSGLLLHDEDRSLLHNVSKHWSESYFDMNKGGHFVDMDMRDTSGWRNPSGFHCITEEQRPLVNKLWGTINRARKTLKHLNFKHPNGQSVYAVESASLFEGKPLSDLAKLTEEEVLDDMVSTDEGKGITRLMISKSKLYSLFAVHIKHPTMEVL